MGFALKTYDEKLKEGTLKPDADQQEAATRLAVLQAALAQATGRGGLFKLFRKSPPPPKGVYLFGPVGRGKSMLMDMFFSNAPVEKKRRVHFHAFMLEVHDYLHIHRARIGDTDDLLISCADFFAAQARLLCFDEFQVRDVADAMILGRLFTALFARGVVVVMTSNVAPDDLYAGGLQRELFLPFIALLKEKLDTCVFHAGVDHRLARIAGRKTHFYPHDEDAQKTLEEIFTDLAGSTPAAPEEIGVKGRVLHVPRAAGPVAMFGFEDLCGVAASALDYLTLAAHYRVFIVSNVPQMDDDRRDQALRFMTLVDTLYECRARLIWSSAVAVKDLYTGDAHGGVFQRTESRLAEMQAQDYGAAQGDKQSDKQKAAVACSLF